MVGLDIGGMKLFISAAAKGELKKNGVEFTQELTEAGGGTKMAFIKAPDEVLIELLERS